MGLQEISTRNRQLSAIALAFALALGAAGCKKKVPPAAPAPPPKAEAPKSPPARPIITQFEAEPSTIERGQSATLRWAVTGEVSNVSISPGIGNVNASGSRTVFPSNTTLYVLKASGPGGDAEMTANVTVREAQPPPPPPKPATPKRTLTEWVSQELQDVYYDYDKSDIREDARAVLTRNADAIKRALAGDYPTANFIVEGHADERGSAEYNLGLSDRRATAAIDFLVQLGVPADRLKPVSYGKERPQCTESTESCWQMNRRAHFTAGQ